jgi:hypothetical protein
MSLPAAAVIAITETWNEHTTLFTLSIDLGTVQLSVVTESLDELLSAGINPDPLKAGLAQAVSTARLGTSPASSPAAHPPAADTGSADPWMTVGPAPQPQPAPPVHTPAGATWAPQGSAQAGPTVVNVQGSKGPQQWTLNAPGAPYCACGQPAGQVRAKGSGGRDYTAWRCAKGAGDDWRTKCDFNQWA